jgi:hypothetical protein
MSNIRKISFAFYKKQKGIFLLDREAKSLTLFEDAHHTALRRHQYIQAHFG